GRPAHPGDARREPRLPRDQLPPPPPPRRHPLLRDRDPLRPGLPLETRPVRRRPRPHRPQPARGHRGPCRAHHPHAHPGAGMTLTDRTDVRSTDRPADRAADRAPGPVPDRALDRSPDRPVGPDPEAQAPHEALPLGPALLFCPGDRPDRFRKAADRADAVILDLEDAVAPERKQAARAVVAAPAALRPGWVMLPTAGSRADVGRLVAALPSARVLVLCETARGILAAPELAAHPDVAALMWGGEDLVADLGGTSSRDATGGYREVVRHARAAVLLAARAHGRSAIDAVHLDLKDLDGQRAEA